MANWATINEASNNFRLLCSNEDCSLSVCNLLNGKLSISSVHGNKRHSMVLSTRDMLFIVSQFIKNLSKEDREKVLEFYQNF